MNATNPDKIKLSQNIIIADADYVSHVMFDLTVNFERMLDRRMPDADLAQWIIDIALDGGMRQGKNETEVVLVHEKSKHIFEYFTPSDYDTQINNKAFNDPAFGEFAFNTIAESSVANKQQIISDLIDICLQHDEVKRLMIVPNAEDDDTMMQLRHALRNAADDKSITVFAMDPIAGGNFKQEILGYSLTNALGITQDEIDRKLKE